MECLTKAEKSFRSKNELLTYLAVKSLSVYTDGLFISYYLLITLSLVRMLDCVINSQMV
jgi:hypothetical protein